jgi:hypothetical protein
MKVHHDYYFAVSKYLCAACSQRPASPVLPLIEFNGVRDPVIFLPKTVQTPFRSMKKTTGYNGAYVNCAQITPFFFFKLRPDFIYAEKV